MIANTIDKEQTNSKPERTHPRSAPASGAATRARGAPADVEERARELMIMAAHDLCSPLAAIKLRAAAVARRWDTGEEPTSAEWASAVHSMRRAADEACVD
jgi:hypothetical protein